VSRPVSDRAATPARRAKEGSEHSGVTKSARRRDHVRKRQRRRHSGVPDGRVQVLVQLGQPGTVLLYDTNAGGPHAIKANGVRIIIIIIFIWSHLLKKIS